MALGITPIEIVNKGTHPLLVKDSEWERVELSNIADVQNGYAFSSGLFNHKEGLPLIRIRDIFSTKTENYYSGDYSEDFVVSHNDILIGMDGDFKISRWPGQKGLLNQRVCRIRFFSSYYLESFLFICVQPYLDAIHSETSAVTVKHLSSRTINDIPLPLPPLPIQRAIVSKIEALFSDLDNGIANLKKAQEQLKIYRQAVLKKAFQGGLSNILRTDELPLGWIEGELGNIISISSGKGLTKENREDDGVYFVYGGNGITGKHSEFLYENEKLIIGRVGVHCGNVHITKPKSWITDNAFVVSFDEDVFDLHFLHYFLTNLNLNKYASSTAQPVISQGKIYPIEISYPNTKEEQTQIVQEIESRLSVCDKMEQSINESIAKAEALRQSILKKAFEGELLSQAEIAQCKQAADYEPASELLKKIQAEKLAKEQEKKKKPKTKK